MSGQSLERQQPAHPSASGRMRGKVALVVGAGGGMGTAVPGLFAREGARVALGGRRAEPLQALAEKLRARGGVAEVVTGDATTPEGSSAMVERTLAHYGQLDVLYLNVGDYAQGDRRPHETDPDAWQYLLDVNLSSAFYPCRAAIPAMLGRGGSIVVVSASESVRRGANPGYASAKAALLTLSRNLARQYRADGIRVNCLCPGSIGGSQGEGDFAAPPLGLVRPAHPADVAYAALYLASDESAWITGQMIEVDGGAGL
jgi:NAD(P)-dependent dehydrogenase (short-subunit alcohol dehydrogenase family)